MDAETNKLEEYVMKYHDYVPHAFRHPREEPCLTLSVDLDPVTAKHLYEILQSQKQVTPNFPTTAGYQIRLAILDQKTPEEKSMEGEDISQWLKATREKAGETKEETAKALNINEFIIEQYESGALRARDSDKIKLAKHFSHSKEEFTDAITELFHVEA